MRLIKAKFVNYCQHLDRTVEFTPGLNVIVGPNGSGKSNIVNGIYGAITGDFSRNAGKTADNVSLFTKPGNKTLVQLNFSHNNENYFIERRLDVAERKLVTPSETLIADKDVLEKLYGILGIRKEILTNYVFVEQWDNFGPIAQTPAKRFDSLRRLFKIDQIDAIINELSNSDYKLHSTAATLISLPEQTARLNSLNTTIEDLNNKLVGGKESIEKIDSQIADYSNVVTSWATKTSLESSIKARETELKTTTEAAELNRQKAETCTNQVAHINKAISELRPSLDIANKIETDWVKYDFYTIRKKELDNQLNSLKTDQARHSEPEKPSDYLEDPTVLANTLEELKATQAKYTDFVSNYNFESSEALCPTCKQPAQHLADSWKEQKEKLSGIAKDIVRITKQIASNAAYDRAAYAYSVWKTNFDKNMEAVSFAYASLVVETKPEYSRDQAKQIIDTNKELLTSLAEFSSELSALNLSWASLNAKTESLTKELAREKNELTKYDHITAEAINSANTLIADLKEKKQAINSLFTQLAVAHNELKAVNNNIELANKQMHQAELFGSWNNRFEDLKKAYKTNKEKSIPMVITRRYMGAVIDELNSTLSHIGMAFTINLLDDLSFQADFGTHKVPAERLSGGQKVMLTIAYRLAVNCTFAAEMGLLCLDEPTVGLDDANLVGLNKAFERLKEYAANSGTQIVAITHEKGISHMFDNVIDLG